MPPRFLTVRARGPRGHNIPCPKSPEIYVTADVITCFKGTWLSLEISQFQCFVLRGITHNWGTVEIISGSCVRICAPQLQIGVDADAATVHFTSATTAVFR